MAVNYMGYLANLLGKEVRVNRVGPDSVVGTLLSIQSDYLVVRSKEGTVYINTAHIKSITEVGSKSGRSGSRLSSSSGIIRAQNFIGVLRQLHHKFISVNGGPERTEGFVVTVNDDYLTLLVNRELVRIPIFHIKHVILSRNNVDDHVI
jgi:spore coat protein B